MEHVIQTIEGKHTYYTDADGRKHSAYSGCANVFGYDHVLDAWADELLSTWKKTNHERMSCGGHPLYLIDKGGNVSRLKFCPLCGENVDMSGNTYCPAIQISL